MKVLLLNDKQYYAKIIFLSQQNIRGNLNENLLKYMTPMNRKNRSNCNKTDMHEILKKYFQTHS